MSTNTYDPIEITLLYVFGTTTPLTDDYNEHIRPLDANNASITYDMLAYMTSGGGRYATPALFGAVEKIFNTTIADGVYTYADFQKDGHLVLTGDDISLTISQYGTDTSSADFADRAYIFGTSGFKLRLENATFEVINGAITIKGMEVRAGDDNFDFDSNNPLAILLGTFLFEPTFDPYSLARGTQPPDYQAVSINFRGSGTNYSSYSYADYLLNKQFADEFVSYVIPDSSIGGILIRSAKDAAGIASLLAGEGPEYFQKIAADQFLSYMHNGLKVIYGTPNSDLLTEWSKELSFDSYDGYFMVGGAGDDTLIGEAFADELLGGNDNDTLTGMGGNDTLEGGAGDDTYIYHSGDGMDTIIDSDGQGRISYDGVMLTGGQQLGDNRVFQGTDANNTQHTYIFVTGNKDSGGDLLIDGVILIRNFHNNDLNLALNAAAPEQTPQTGRAINGDFKPMDNDITQSGIQIVYDDLNNIQVSDEADPGRADTLNDSTGNDAINSGAGNDVINAFRGGDDLIDAGAGQDKVLESNAAAGNDVISGGADNDILAGGLGDDRIYADHVISVAEAVAGGNSQDGSGQKGDWLAGELGDDTLVGAAGNDVLAGGSGDDLLIGGAGDDDIIGDANWVAATFDWNVTWVSTGQNTHERHYNPVNETALAGTGADVVYAGTSRGNDWTGAGNDIIFGEDGNDGLNGEGGNDIMIGGAGQDGLSGSEGDDIMAGGIDDDLMGGGPGMDAYICNQGDGHDTIIDPDKDNLLIFGEGINKDNITLKLGSLLLDLGNGDAVHIDGFDQNDVFNSSSVSTFSFADGSTLTLNQLLARGFDLNGSNQNDTIGDSKQGILYA